MVPSELGGRDATIISVTLVAWHPIRCVVVNHTSWLALDNDIHDTRCAVAVHMYTYTCCACMALYGT